MREAQRQTPGADIGALKTIHARATDWKRDRPAEPIKPVMSRNAIIELAGWEARQPHAPLPGVGEAEPHWFDEDDHTKTFRVPLKAGVNLFAGGNDLAVGQNLNATPHSGSGSTALVFYGPTGNEVTRFAVNASWSQDKQYKFYKAPNVYWYEFKWELHAAITQDLSGTEFRCSGFEAIVTGWTKPDGSSISGGQYMNFIAYEGDLETIVLKP